MTANSVTPTKAVPLLQYMFAGMRFLQLCRFFFFFFFFFFFLSLIVAHYCTDFPIGFSKSINIHRIYWQMFRNQYRDMRLANIYTWKSHLSGNEAKHYEYTMHIFCGFSCVSW